MSDESNSFSRSYGEREDKSIEELREETIEALGIVLGDIEYILGNGDFQSSDTFNMMEEMHVATGEMMEILESDELEEDIDGRI